MTDTFISYSRKDKPFVRKLFDALESTGRDAWIDWEGIASAAPDFLAEIYEGIESADTFLIIVTPNSLKSEICNLEIAHALKHHKRIVPVVHREVTESSKLLGEIAQEWYGSSWEDQARTNWETLSHINWLFFRESDDFDNAFQGLVKTLDTDLDHVKYHTRLTIRAREWEDQENSDDFVLLGDDLTAAEGWLSISQHKEPSPTPLHREYIKASISVRERELAEVREQQQRELQLQKAAAQRLRYLLSAAVIFLIVAVGLSIFAFGQSQTAQRERDNVQTQVAIADRRAEEAQSVSWAISAGNEASDQAYDLALPLALAATRIDNPPLIARDTLLDVALAPGMVRRVGQYHTSGIQSVAISPDGQSALSGSLDNTLILWDTATGTPIRTFIEHRDSVWSVAISPDGQQALSGAEDDTLILWDMATGIPLKTLSGHSDWVNDVAFNPAPIKIDGISFEPGQMALSASSDHTLILWDLDTGEAIRTFTGHSDSISSIAISGQTALAGSCGERDEFGFCVGGEMILWDMVTGTILQTFSGHENWVNSVAISGQIAVSASSDHTLILWDLDTGQPLRTLNGHIDSVNSVVIRGQTALSASSDNTLSLWDLDTGELLHTFVANQFPIEGIAISPDGQSAVSGSDELILWDLTTGESVRRFTGHANMVRSVAINPTELEIDGTVYEVGQTALSGSLDNTLILWNVATGGALRTYTGHTDLVTSFAFDGQRAISGSADGTLILWDLETGDALETFAGHSTFVSSVAVNLEDETALSASLDGTLILWDLASGNDVRTLSGHSDWVTSVAINPEPLEIDGTDYDAGGIAVSGSCGTRETLGACKEAELIVWDLARGEVLMQLNEHNDWINSVAISGQRMISASSDNTLIQWDLETGEALETYTGHEDAVNSVAFNPESLEIDGKLFAPGQAAVSGSHDDRVILWDLMTGDPLRIFSGHANWVWSVAFSPDGQRVLSGSEDRTLILWDLATEAALQTFRGHEDWVWSVAVSPDGQTALSGSCGEREDSDPCAEGEMIVWDMATGDAVQTFAGHADTVWTVAISPDDQTALSGSCGEREDSGSCIEGEMILWDMATGDALRQFAGHADTVWAVAISPDGQTALSASSDSTLILWDLESGDPLKTLQGHSDSVYSVAINGQRALSGSGDTTLILWDLETGEPLKTFSGHSDSVFSVAINPMTLEFGGTVYEAGQTALSGSADGTLILWDLAAGLPLKNFIGHTGLVRNIAISADGRIAASASADGSMIAWDMATGIALQTFREHLSPVWSVAISPDGRMALSGGADNNLKSWYIQSIDELTRWTYDNRVVRELTCQERILFNFEPGCDESGIYPFRTPYPGARP